MKPNLRRLFRAIGSLLAALCFASAAFAGAIPPSGGDLGIPPDYENTILRFRDLMPDFLSRAAALPSSFDWRSTGKVTPAKNQQMCGGCWAFASVGAFESKLLIQGSGTYNLSEQQQISCNTEMYGCGGGSMTSLRFWEGSTGPMQESCTGYTSTNGVDGECSSLSSCSQLPYHTTGYYTVDMNNRDEIKTSLSNDGPTYFRFNTYTDFSTFWSTASSGAVYTNAGGTATGGHAVLLIGWDDAKGAWLLKNSWGESSGPNRDGSFWMAYAGHSNNLEFGMANVRISGGTPSATQPDILWSNRNSGNTGVWKMYLTSLLGWAGSRNVASPWQVKATGDFDHDGKTDVLWSNTSTGVFYVVYMNGADWKSSTRLGSIPTAWTIRGTGDFDGDGNLDIVWRNNSTGKNAVMYMQGETQRNVVLLPDAGPEWIMAGVADFNNDGKPDILFRNTSQGQNVIWYMDNLSITSTAALEYVAPQWCVGGIGDFDQDGVLDIFWRNYDTGGNVVMLLNGVSRKNLVWLQSVAPSAGWDAVGVGVFH